MSSHDRNAYGGHRNMQFRNFFCNAPAAQQVSLVGDFNRWNPRSNPMVRGADGIWTIRLEFRHGHHRFAFEVDGQLVLDPTAMGITKDDQGRRVSLMAVS
jgi:1,4-alpha-glucan branching enzyme